MVFVVQVPEEECAKASASRPGHLTIDSSNDPQWNLWIMPNAWGKNVASAQEVPPAYRLILQCAYICDGLFSLSCLLPYYLIIHI